ncbi:hypothetical protein V8J88_14250 [Massilia sp. W12]|uniref:hypothetical protein n=1 Tax=Massilia sp. W12 TaxID=3126507 RepID=UPI0030D3A3C3
MQQSFALLDAQLQANAHSENVLPSSDFISLLQRFADELGASAPDPSQAKQAWCAACYAHGRRGRVMPTATAPIMLGRVNTVKNQARWINQSPASKFNADEAKEFLLDEEHDPDFIAALRQASLGKYNLWATFDERDSARNPFTGLPQNYAGITAALGLNMTEPIITLVWEHRLAGAPALHRPTIADAAENPLFRPHGDADAFWGYTYPRPYATPLPPMPEVVLQEISGAGLQLPYKTFKS